MALELLEQVAAEGVSLDAIVVPVSGGGMISGIAVASKTLQPEGLAVVAAEPSGANNMPDVALSLEAGRWIGFPDIACVAAPPSINAQGLLYCESVAALLLLLLTSPCDAPIEPLRRSVTASVVTQKT